MLRKKSHSCEHAWAVIVWENDRWIEHGYYNAEDALIVLGFYQGVGKIAHRYKTPAYCH
jgi:hypothetical protein